MTRYDSPLGLKRNITANIATIEKVRIVRNMFNTPTAKTDAVSWKED
jgi:hypothetical protein